MPTPRSLRSRRILALLLFAGAIGLNAWTLKRALETHPVGTPLSPPLVVNADEIAATQRDMAGIFITGERPGDRYIVIEPGGSIRFYEIGFTEVGPPDVDTFQLGKIDRRRYLLTRAHGIVEVAGLDTLIYYGDRYTRTHSEPTPSDPSAAPYTPRRPARSASRRRPETRASRPRFFSE